jgi:hypothetical protein
MKKTNNVKSFRQFNENLNISDVSDSKNKYTVVSFDYKQMKWGIEGDFYANDEDDAMKQAKEQAKKYGIKRQMFNIFLSDSDELKDFIETHDFVD